MIAPWNVVERGVEDAWSPILTVTRDEALRYLGPIVDAFTERNSAQIAEDCGVCPTGLRTPVSDVALAVWGNCERTGASPSGKGSLDEPSSILEALATIEHRRALDERRNVPKRSGEI